MTSLALTMVSVAAFLASLRSKFLWDACRATPVVIFGLTMASLVREVAPAQVFVLDQQCGFMIGVASAMAILFFSNVRMPSLISLLFALWIHLEILAFVYIGRAPSLFDYMDQKTAMYPLALIFTWVACSRIKIDAKNG